MEQDRPVENARALSFRTVEKSAAVVASVLCFIMMLVVVFDVSMRAIFNRPLLMGLELTELLMVGITYLGFANTQREGGFIRIELLTSHLPRAGRTFTDYLNQIISLVFVAILFWQSTLLSMQSLRIMEMTPGLSPLPVYPARIIISVGSGLMLITILIMLFSMHRGRK
ncbi:MAG: TRAP transporter small permease [Chloroflexi bacterium]|nr:TRAP transporter small permease [Chloroflexota bacterium]